MNEETELDSWRRTLRNLDQVLVSEFLAAGVPKEEIMNNVLTHAVRAAILDVVIKLDSLRTTGIVIQEERDEVFK